MLRWFLKVFLIYLEISSLDLQTCAALGPQHTRYRVVLKRRVQAFKTFELNESHNFYSQRSFWRPKGKSEPNPLGKRKLKNNWESYQLCLKRQHEMNYLLNKWKKKKSNKKHTHSERGWGHSFGSTTEAVQSPKASDESVCLSWAIDKAGAHSLGHVFILSAVPAAGTQDFSQMYTAQVSL